MNRTQLGNPAGHGQATPSAVSFGGEVYLAYQPGRGRHPAIDDELRFIQVVCRNSAGAGSALAGRRPPPRNRASMPGRLWGTAQRSAGRGQPSAGPSDRAPASMNVTVQ